MGSETATSRKVGVAVAGPNWKWWAKIIVGTLLFLWIFASQITPCGSQCPHSHGSADAHGHGHDHHDHGHAHDHHDHGHAHDHHGHAHDDHGHSDEPAHHKYSKQANEPHVHAASTAKPKPKSDAHSHSNQIPKPKPQAQPHVHSHDKPKFTSQPERNPNLWFEAISSTLLISAAPFLILFLIPLDNSKEKRHLLKILLSFASGGLLGDAFLHLIPHAILASGGGDEGHGHGHSHGGHSHGDADEAHAHDISVGLWVLVGIVTFLMVEKLIRIMKGGHYHSHGGDSASEAEEEVVKASTKEKKSDDEDSTSGSKDKSTKKSKEDKSKTAVAKVPEKKDTGEIQVAGYLNLAADFTHNFTDGLAIGASYLAGRNVGLVTTFTILLHEVPHEIGDFAILIQSGCNKRKAILLQLITALGALSGTVMSLLAEGMSEAATAWILPFTAGGFIYIATVSVIPELLHNSTLKQSIREVIALLAGIYMMVLIAQYE